MTTPTTDNYPHNASAPPRATLAGVLLAGAAALAAACVPWYAEAEPLLNPWEMFCLSTQETSDVGTCLDGLPAEAHQKLAARGFKVGFKLQLGIVPLDATPTQAQYVCPHEFGDFCDLLVEPVLAFGGQCYRTENNTVCRLD